MRTLMQKMDIHALYQKPRLSEPHPGHKVYPYLLRGLEITRANHVWVTDICYLPMVRGFCYLVAIMDWASRRVLAWRLSNTLDLSFCTDALEEALQNYGTPEIFNIEPGQPVYFGGLYRHFICSWDPDQHGRQRPLDGQGFYRKAVEERQV